MQPPQTPTVPQPLNLTPPAPLVADARDADLQKWWFWTIIGGVVVARPLEPPWKV